MIVVREWFAGRSERERRLLLVMLAVGIPLILWAALVVPLSRAYDRALERQLEAVDRHGRMLAATADRRAPRPTAPAGDIVLLVGDSARRSGVTADAQARDGGTAAVVTVTATSPTAALVWLNALEEQGYLLSDLRVAPDGKGGVTASATVGRGRP